MVKNNDSRPAQDGDAPLAEHRELSGEQAAQEAADSSTDTDRQGTSLAQIAQSVGAALLGVQSKKNKERDFQQGKPIHFIVGGLVGVFLFLIAIWLLVLLVIATAT